MLTDEQCHVFRILPVSFNDMVRAIFEAGRDAQRESDAKICEEEESKSWCLRETRDWSPYIEGMSDGAGECAVAIRANKGE